MSFPVGYTDKYRFTCKKGGELYNPQVVQVSLIKGDGTEDTLTWGGTDPRDSQLLNISPGVFEYWYRFDVPGDWRVNERWTDQGGAAEVKNRDLIVSITDDPHEWGDSP